MRHAHFGFEPVIMTLGYIRFLLKQTNNIEHCTVITVVIPRFHRGKEETGFTFRGSGGNGDSYLDINIDYRDKTAVTAVMGKSSV